jgi:hypothetical protein
MAFSKPRETRYWSLNLLSVGCFKISEIGNKADVSEVKKVTGPTRADAYQRPFNTQVNEPTKNNKVEHVAVDLKVVSSIS